MLSDEASARRDKTEVVLLSEDLRFDSVFEDIGEEEIVDSEEDEAMEDSEEDGDGREEFVSRPPTPKLQTIVDWPPWEPDEVCVVWPGAESATESHGATRGAE